MYLHLVLISIVLVLRTARNNIALVNVWRLCGLRGLFVPCSLEDGFFKAIPVVSRFSFDSVIFHSVDSEGVNSMLRNI